MILGRVGSLRVGRDEVSELVRGWGMGEKRGGEGDDMGGGVYSIDVNTSFPVVVMP